jgi:beta-N-acetylhexosaminidase
VWFVQNSTSGVKGIRAVADSVQRLARSQVTGGVRFFVAANQEGGEIQALQGPGFSRIPAADQQGTIDPQTLQVDAQRWGAELASGGVNFDFAPVVDVVPPGTDAINQPIGSLHRAFGHESLTVAQHGVAFVRGMALAGVATSAKHFPGLGRVRGNTDDVSNVMDALTRADSSDLSSFQRAIDGGVPFVMVALATYSRIDSGHLAVFSRKVIEQVLRSRLRFQGVIISDDLGSTAAVSSIPPGQRAVDFISAGGDMIIAKTIASASAMDSAILAREAVDETFSTRVNEAVLHVLRSKERPRLLPCP